jgi:hypothetical protein
MGFFDGDEDCEYFIIEDNRIIPRRSWCDNARMIRVIRGKSLELLLYYFNRDQDLCIQMTSDFCHDNSGNCNKYIIDFACNNGLDGEYEIKIFPKLREEMNQLNELLVEHDEVEYFEVLSKLFGVLDRIFDVVDSILVV